MINEYYEYQSVKEVSPLSDYRLAVTFAEGSERVFDVKPYLDVTFWAPLKNISLFNEVSRWAISCLAGRY